MEMNGEKLLEKEIENYLLKLLICVYVFWPYSPASENLHLTVMMNV